MANRVRLAKAATTGVQPSIRIRTAKPPFLVSSDGGAVTLQHTMSGPDVADADADWHDLATIADGDQIDVTHPLYRIRIDVTAGTATVDLLEFRGAF